MYNMCIYCNTSIILLLRRRRRHRFCCRVVGTTLKQNFSTESKRPEIRFRIFTDF